MKKSRFHVEFDVVGSTIEDRFLSEKVELDERTIRNILNSAFKPKGDLGGDRLGDCELENIEVKEVKA